MLLGTFTLPCRPHAMLCYKSRTHRPAVLFMPFPEPPIPSGAVLHCLCPEPSLWAGSGGFLSLTSFAIVSLIFYSMSILFPLFQSFTLPCLSALLAFKSPVDFEIVSFPPLLNTYIVYILSVNWLIDSGSAESSKALISHYCQTSLSKYQYRLILFFSPPFLYHFLEQVS